MIVPPKDPKYQHGTGVAGQSGNTGDNEKRDKIQRARERLAKAQREDNVKEMGYGMKPMKKMKPMK